MDGALSKVTSKLTLTAFVAFVIFYLVLRAVENRNLFGIGTLVARPVPRTTATS